MISTGISCPDGMLGGGIPEGSEVRMPIVIAANKHDLPGATGEKAIRSILGIPDNTPVFFISALQKSGSHRVLESMVDHITQFSF